MRVLLVYPNIATRNGPHYPHGLGALAAVLAEGGHEPVVRLVEVMPTREEWLKDLAVVAPDFVACSFGSHQWRHARALLGWSRQAGHRVLAGGVHATFAADEVRRADVCDWVCVGEGEGAVADLASGMEPRSVANLVGDDFANAPRPLIADLDRQPIYDRRHFPMDDIGRVNAGEVTVLVGRGCPFPCAYCCNPAWRELYGGQPWVRWRSVPNVLAELDLLRARYTVESFYFEDDIFTLNRTFLDAFLDEYKRGFRVPFRCYLRIGEVTRDDLARLKDAGLALANVGVEHGDERLRAEMLGRRMSNKQIEDFFGWCRELGIRTRAFHIVGVPGETPETLQATVKLCERVAPDEVQVSLFEPYPGTQLFRLCREQGIIRGVERDTYFTAAPAITLRDFPDDELVRSFNEFCSRTPHIEKRAFDLALAAQKRGAVDLVAAWSAHCVTRQGAEPVARRRVRLGDEEMFCLFAHPRCEIEYNVEPGEYRLVTALALDPRCLAWGGGGVRFTASVGDQPILDRFLDPKHNTTDAGWHKISTPFHVERQSKLTLSTQPDANGELTALWALWGHPHLVREDRR